MRACTLKNNVLKDHENSRVYLCIKGVTYELGKVFITDDKLDEAGNVTEYGKILLFADKPVEQKPEVKETKSE